MLSGHVSSSNQKKKIHVSSTLTRASNLAIVPENTFQNSPKTIHPRKLSHPPAGHLALEVLVYIKYIYKIHSKDSLMPPCSLYISYAYQA